MASKTGLVHRVWIDSGGNACIFIGPTPVNVEILPIKREASDPAHIGAFKTSMLDALTQALAARREVTVGHNDTDAYISSVELR